MARIMMFSNMDRFAEVIGRCRGDVYLNLPDKTRCNLKENREALQLLRLLRPAQDGLDVDLADQADFPLVVRYMMDSAQI